MLKCHQGRASLACKFLRALSAFIAAIAEFYVCMRVICMVEACPPNRGRFRALDLICAF